MLIWGGESLTGVQRRIEIGQPTLDAQHTKYFGLIGVSQINGERGELPLACEMWLNNDAYTSPLMISAVLDSLLLQVGHVDDLIEEGPQQFRTFADCEFNGFEQLGDILPAIGAGMTSGTYFVHLRLHWTQLTPGWD